MKFGMPTLLENKNIDGCVLLCKELKLDFIELNMNFPAKECDCRCVLETKTIAGLKETVMNLRKTMW